MTAMAASVPGLYVGTSGFSYPTWRPDFYPEGTKPVDFLRFYSQRFPSVELNTSAYQLPSEEHFRTWAEQVPPGFRFAVRMPRQITHGSRLGLVATFCERVRLLGDKLGPVLVVLERKRDDGFLLLLRDSLDPELEVAFDLRHDSWEGVEVPVRVDSLDGDAHFRYVRFRDPPYDDGELTEWAATLRPLLEDGLRVYAYFKHEDEPTGPTYARRLLELLAG
ncbi:MAG: DUF72 domain-containing protein [Actinobacteria bacterium]|nr:MAG: DUF72 domain-containing protein [Actinomycetota bacterium]